MIATASVHGPRLTHSLADLKRFLFIHVRICIYSVSARPRHCGNLALQSEKTPRKTEEGLVKPFTFTRLQA